ncbi:MAG: hypothetical protein AUH78_07590 [Gemmatimonadetes bacterium 13_1_40CM_4_69_8]|nr:MAG: hypothetical protein AUH45_02445 [Gemmatimonadetes bacterium 13_1_40CM_69_22]OLC76039.1 MAG: hypothetical protein AUH78_07590 [Gemmatimonadetes bacterium 13_1_40CM_4_69_8]
MRTPFMRALTRTTIAALVLALALLVALPRHGSLGSDFVDVFTLTFCFTFLGHYIDALLRALPGIETGPGRLVRLAGWFAGGLWCYLVARWLWIRYGRDLNDLPGLVWGGAFLVVLELIMSAVSRQPSAKDPADS